MTGKVGAMTGGAKGFFRKRQNDKRESVWSVRG